MDPNTEFRKYVFGVEIVIFIYLFILVFLK